MTVSGGVLARVGCALACVGCALGGTSMAVPVTDRSKDAMRVVRRVCSTETKDEGYCPGCAG